MLVFKKVKKLLGLERCKTFGSAAAPIMKDTLDFFASLDIRLDEVYGMSECTGMMGLVSVYPGQENPVFLTLYHTILTFQDLEKVAF